MFSANKITGMTVVLSETLKEIISDQDKFQRDHPYSVFNQKRTNAGKWKYVAVKPWENVQKGQIPPQTTRRPNAGYTGHVPALRETHSATYGTSLNLAKSAAQSSTIRHGEHYADGAHFSSTQEVGSLAGGKLPAMPASAVNSPAPSVCSSSRRRRPDVVGTARSRGSRHSSEQQSVRSGGSNRSAFNRAGDTMGLVQGDVLGDTRAQYSSRSGASSIHSSQQSTYSTMSQAAQAHRVKQLFKELPPSRQASLIQEMNASVQ